MAKTFNTLTEKASGTVLIVDALNLAFRWKHQGRTDFREQYVETVKSFQNSYKCDRVIITADWGSSSYRKELLPTYKQNRKDKYAEQTPEEAQKFVEFFDEYEATLELLEETYQVFRFQSVEADDIAAFLVAKRKDFGFNKIWLLSSDRDWDLLIAEDVSRFSYVNRKEFTLENWNEHYEVSPEQYISFKCLTGDAGDNVPGIKGIGPKRAAELLNTYGDAFSIYDALPIPGKYKYLEELNNSGDLLLLNYQLMDLVTYCEEAVGVDNAAEVIRRMMNAA